MATKQLFQILLRNRDGIKQGITKVQDIVTEYLSTTGAKAISPNERFTINKEFSELAPSNVIGDIFGDFQGLQDDAGDVVKKSGAFDAIDETAEGFDPNYMKGLTDTDNVIKKSGAFDAVDETAEGFDPNYMRGLTDTDTPFTDRVSKEMGTKLRGDETFGELMDKMRKSPFDEAAMAKNKSDMAKKQGLGSLYPKGEPGEIFDEANSKRAEMAAFMKAMREAGIKNEDVINTAKITDVAEGKRAATTLARAAETGADTKIKQEILSELDEQVMDKGPRFFQEEYMGYDSMGNLLENITTTVNNGIYDDLIEQGVPEDKVSSIFRYIASVRNNMKYDPKAVLRKIADDIEMEDIKYDTTFWDNYIDEILSRIQKPEPRFAVGGMV